MKENGVQFVNCIQSKPAGQGRSLSNSIVSKKHIKDAEKGKVNALEISNHPKTNNHTYNK